MIIGIHGKFRSGKDTVARLFAQNLTSLNQTITRHAFADSLKEIVEILTGEIRTTVIPGYTISPRDFSEEQKNKYLDSWEMTLGTMLQKLGTDVMRNNFNELIWIHSMWTKIKDKYQDEIIIVTDVRFLNELAFLKKMGAILIKVEGDPSGMAVTSTRNNIHQSETDLDNYNDFDFVIKNNETLEKLEQKIIFISSQIINHYRHIYIN